MKTLKETVLLEVVHCLRLGGIELFYFCYCEIGGKENGEQFNVSIQEGAGSTELIAFEVSGPQSRIKRLQLFQTRA